jgi:hypothetical protein
VFLFGEFHIPRAQVVAAVLAHRRQPFAEAPDLGHTRGRELGGQYLDVYQGHLLRWTKQLACRGSVRNLDGEGRCGPMRLYTSMDLPRLAGFRAGLFPGAPPPVLLQAEDEANPAKGPGAVLCRLLATEPEGTVLSSDEVEASTGIRSSNLRRTFGQREVRLVAEGYGWRLTTAKELGLPGKRLFLARSSGPADHPDLAVAA